MNLHEIELAATGPEPSGFSGLAVSNGICQATSASLFTVGTACSVSAVVVIFAVSQAVSTSVPP